MFAYLDICRVCVWTAIFLILLSIFNACTIISRFTRIAGELFGMLIAVLFLQEAINVPIPLSTKSLKLQITCFSYIHTMQGLVSEFRASKSEHDKSRESDFLWPYTNGLLAVIFSLGLLITALKSRRAKSWKYGFGTLLSIHIIHLKVCE